jgi:hypothetical protein
MLPCTALLAISALQPSHPSQLSGVRATVRSQPLVLCAFDLRTEVIERRRARSLGLVAGGTLLGGAAAAGAALGIVDLSPAVPVVALATVATAFNTARHNENSDPIDPSSVEVRPAPAGRGEGLFARVPIASGTYLFDYEGDRLTEEDFFARYPTAQGRYTACIDACLPWQPPRYIDGADAARSGVARWINHSARRANVYYRKQRFGEPAMHFYAMRDIAADEELAFDYGEGYWAALGETPMD